MSGRLTHAKTHYPFKRGCSSSTEEARLFSCRSLSILMYSSPWKTDQCQGCQRGLCFLSKVQKRIPTGRWLKQSLDFPVCSVCMAAALPSVTNSVISIRKTQCSARLRSFPCHPQYFQRGNKGGKKYQCYSERKRAGPHRLYYCTQMKSASCKLASLPSTSWFCCFSLCRTLI